MLTGHIKSFDDIPDKDTRKMMPRFQPENFDVNMKLVNELGNLARKKSCTSAQLALGWLTSLSRMDGMPTIIPIPGATTAKRVKENAVEIELSKDEMKEIDEILASCEVIGDRYPSQLMKVANG